MEHQDDTRNGLDRRQLHHDDARALEISCDSKDIRGTQFDQHRNQRRHMNVEIPHLYPQLVRQTSRQSGSSISALRSRIYCSIATSSRISLNSVSDVRRTQLRWRTGGKNSRVMAREVSGHPESEEIVLEGWLEHVRHLGNVAFAVLRDSSGRIQVTWDQESAENQVCRVRFAAWLKCNPW
eukprot:867294-Amorphochlora_amoeboformis.AAC.1